MPPKPKYSKEEIVKRSYELMKEEGIDAVVAREVGKRLNTSSTPIFTYFTGMSELKKEIKNLAVRNVYEYMEGIENYAPAFKEFGMRWVKFSIEQPNVYRFLFGEFEEESLYEKMTNIFGDKLDMILKLISAQFSVSKEVSERILRNLIIYSNGMRMFAAGGDREFTDEEISRSISEICIGLVLLEHAADRTINPDIAERQAKAAKSGTPTQKMK